MKKDWKSTAMITRRQIIRTGWRLFSGAWLALGPADPALRSVWAAVKRTILPPGTDLQSLKNENPGALDTRNLEIMPVEKFETMGPTDHAVVLEEWRLEVAGKVKTPLSLTYAEMLALTAVERNELLICPSIFTIHARWKGLTLSDLLDKAGIEASCSGVTVHGPKGTYEKVENFTLEEVRSGGVFLAYGVNGQSLPQKHGFPLRLVAPDRYGSDWIKYVYKVEAR
jgi:DMSO/TMAO reductase YedYZ molybdopterin-dependent catalytic subunit